MSTNKCNVSDLQPGVSQCFAHTEPPPDRHLQQVVDETDGWWETEAQKISRDHLKNGPLESPSGQREKNVLGMNVKALQTRTVWANFVQTLQNVKDHIALMKSCNKLIKNLSRIDVKV